MESKSRKIGIYAAVVLLGATVLIRAEDAETQRAPSAQKQFLHGALDANQMMIRAGQLAETKATHPAVRKLGRTLAQDHRQMNAQLVRIAREQNVTDDQELGREHQQALNRLRSLGGTDFDRGFLRMVIRDHKRDLVMLQKRKESADENSELDELIKQELPTVRRHLQMAQAASRQLNLALNDFSGSAGYRNSVLNPGNETADVPEEDRGEVLGMPTSNRDGTILGWFPAPSRKVEAGSRRSYIAEELGDGEVSGGVENIWQADQDTVGAPPPSQREERASALERDTRAPQAVRNALRDEGFDSRNMRLRRVTVFEADADGEKVYVTSRGQILKPSGE